MQHSHAENDPYGEPGPFFKFSLIFHVESSQSDVPHTDIIIKKLKKVFRNWHPKDRKGYSELKFTVVDQEELRNIDIIDSELAQHMRNKLLIFRHFRRWTKMGFLGTERIRVVDFIWVYPELLIVRGKRKECEEAFSEFKMELDKIHQFVFTQIEFNHRILPWIYLNLRLLELNNSVEHLQLPGHTISVRKIRNISMFSPYKERSKGNLIGDSRTDASRVILIARDLKAQDILGRGTSDILVMISIMLDRRFEWIELSTCVKINNMSFPIIFSMKSSGTIYFYEMDSDNMDIDLDDDALEKEKLISEIVMKDLLRCIIVTKEIIKANNEFASNNKLKSELTKLGDIAEEYVYKWIEEVEQEDQE